ncbi:MAG: hypothetical protein U9Q81_09875 [Pseudomonadota bacterium]|nr:hypothetical protein [Pseudomonadota bacterium]
MDILLTAILGALAKLSDTAVRDAYQALKGLIRKKFGTDSGLSEAVDAVEKKPDSRARQDMLKEELTEGQAGADDELLTAARAVIDTVRNLPDGQGVIQKIQVTQNIRGDRNIVTGTGDIQIGPTSN